MQILSVSLKGYNSCTHVCSGNPFPAEPAHPQKARVLRGEHRLLSLGHMLGSLLCMSRERSHAACALSVV